MSYMAEQDWEGRAARMGMQPGDANRLPWAAALAVFAAAFWDWYGHHAADHIFTFDKKILFFKVHFDVEVHHAKPIFIALFGPPPAVTTDGISIS